MSSVPSSLPTYSLSSSIPFTTHHNDPQVVASQESVPTSPSSSSPPNRADNIENTSPLVSCFLAGGLGGAVGDSIMHSLDTVKTRQQGSPTTLKYRNTIPAYATIFKEEGFVRGLYGGYGAAMLGSFPSALIFFVTYESTKRYMISDLRVPDTLTHLTAGFLGDFASSIFYVPSEVLKTRLQLQGRLNNPYFQSGYNYKSTWDAIKTICQVEGKSSLFYGYKATLVRDLPFSALQFAFYEKFRDIAFELTETKDQLSVGHELLVGASAGGLAGIITTPLDVIKTRIQTQHQNTTNKEQKFLSSSIFNSLKTVAKQEGLLGLFSGVGPRFIWTSIQSSIMLFLYQVTLRQFDKYLDDSLQI